MIVLEKHDAESKYVKKLKAEKTAKTEHKALAPLSVQERRAHIKKINGTATSDHSKILRKNLEEAGEKPNDGDHAHHIVASTHSKAKKGRDILEDFGIKINAAINGVFVDALYHGTLHTEKKIEIINDALKTCKDRNGVKNILRVFKTKIKNKQF